MRIDQPDRAIHQEHGNGHHHWWQPARTQDEEQPVLLTAHTEARKAISGDRPNRDREQRADDGDDQTVHEPARISGKLDLAFRVFDEALAQIVDALLPPGSLLIYLRIDLSQHLHTLGEQFHESGKLRFEHDSWRHRGSEAVWLERRGREPVA